MIFYCDGGAKKKKNNAGGASIFCVVSEDEKYKIITKFDYYQTNNVMEYLAVIHALNHCNNGDLLITDSKLVVEQVMGRWNCSAENLIPLRNEAQKLRKQKKANLVWNSREINKAGKILEKTKY
jgi:ribonuclease HI